MKTEEKTKKFILRAVEKHGDKYDYSKVSYSTCSKEVCIICPIHGEFWQSPKDHLRTNGCKLCEQYSRRKIKDLEAFITIANEIHNNKYDYSNSVFNGLTEKISIICPTHGEFSIIAGRHLNKKQRGNGCPVCGDIKRRTNCTKTIDEFVSNAKNVYGDRYDYTTSIYKGSTNDISIICRTHGEFITTPNRFLSGHGCPYCAGNKKLTQEEFISRAKEIHGDRYDYRKTIYISRPKKVTITCPKHGDFEQLANSHLIGSGCPVCRNSKMEFDVANMLKYHNVKFEQYVKFDWLGRQSLDFYIPEYKIGIECQGKQHFCPVNGFGGNERYEQQKINDIKKRELCEMHDIQILYFTTIENKFLTSCEYKDSLITNIDELWKLIKSHT